MEMKLKEHLNIIKMAIADKEITSNEIETFLENSSLECIHPDYNERKLLSDTPDDELEQITLDALIRIVQKRKNIVKKILSNQKIKTKKTRFFDNPETDKHILLMGKE